MTTSASASVRGEGITIRIRIKIGNCRLRFEAVNAYKGKNEGVVDFWGLASLVPSHPAVFHSSKFMRVREKNRDKAS